MTRQKKLIMQIIEESHRHPTAEEVFFEARKHLPNIALGTVYRNLGSLTETGEIRRITMAGAPDRFDTAMDPHDHLICRKCGKLKDVRFKGVTEGLKKASGEDILSYELNAYYVCDDCKKQEVK